MVTEEMVILTGPGLREGGEGRNSNGWPGKTCLIEHLTLTLCSDPFSTTMCETGKKRRKMRKSPHASTGGICGKD